MITKEKLHKHIETFPDKMTFEEAIERLAFISKVEKRIHEANKGEVLSHEEAKKKLSKWLK
jgi:predicted transcriptional regulator